MDTDGAASREPARLGGSVVFWARLVDNVARRRILFLAPILLVTAIGVLQVRRTVPVYESTAVLDTSSNPFLYSPDIAVESVASLELDADDISRLINDQLTTDRFVTDIADRAGLRDRIEDGATSLRLLRRALNASTTGTDLVMIRARSTDAAASQELALAAIEVSEEYLTDTIVEESERLEAEQRARLDLVQTRVDEANSAYDGYVATLPDVRIDDLSRAQRLRVDRLTERLQAATRAESEMLSLIEVVRNVGEQARSGSWRIVEVVDEPSVPTGPTNVLPPPALTIVGFVALGLLIAVGAALVTTALDNTVSTPAQLAALSEIPVVVATEPVRLDDWERTDVDGDERGAPADRRGTDESSFERAEAHA